MWRPIFYKDPSRGREWHGIMALAHTLFRRGTSHTTTECPLVAKSRVDHVKLCSRFKLFFECLHMCDHVAQSTRTGVEWEPDVDMCCVLCVVCCACVCERE